MRPRETAIVEFAGDSRGRVPFALVAVLLLLGSSAFAASLSTRGDVEVTDTLDTVLDRTTAATRPALHDAVGTAARDAAREPVLERANSTYGRVLNESTPFRDALRIRVYLAARERLPATQYRHRGVTAVASLPPTPNASALRAAKRRVQIDAVDGGRALRATVVVTLTARRIEDDSNRTAGAPIVRERERFRITVTSPVLLMHDRAERFETRLGRGALKSGLGQQLTARLYPVAWARGGAQYGGAPIENVVTNRHVALATNGGLLAAQRAAFGRTDPEAMDAYRRATARTAIRDVLAVAPRPGDESVTAVLPPPNLPPVGSDGRGNDGREIGVPEGGRPWSPGGPQSQGDSGGPLTTAVNGSADEAFLRFVGGDVATLSATRSQSGGGEPRRIDRVLRGQYRASFRLETAVERLRVTVESQRRPIGDNWTLTAEDRSRSTVVETVDGGSSRLAVTRGQTGPRERVLETYTRRVTVSETTSRRWGNGTAVRETTETRTSVYRVGVAFVGRHAPTGPTVPNRSIRSLFRAGGALNDQNLRPAIEIGERRLIEGQGGTDGVARGAVSGGLERRAVVAVAPPEELRPWVLTDVARLRERVRTVSVRTTRDSLASGTANPSAALAAELRERRDTLVDAPREYDGVADRARIAARTAYLNTVIAVLSERADRYRQGNSGLAAVFESAGVGSPSDVRAAALARDRERVRPRRPWNGALDRDTSTRPSTVALRPDGEPAYLTLAAVERKQVSALAENETYHPLAARNLNLFTVPYGDAVDAVAAGTTDCDAASRGDPVRLRTAGRILIAANGSLTGPGGETSVERGDEPLRRHRNELAASTAEALEAVRARATVAVGRPTRGDVPELSNDEAEAAVAAGFARWDGVGRRAVAAANGSLAVAIAAAAAEEGELTRLEHDLLRTHLRAELRDVVAGSRVEFRAVESTTSRVRAVVRETLKREAKRAAGNLTAEAAERALGPRFRGIPAGLPLLPVPGYWIATVNVWHVQVRGEYARFTIHARTGTPESAAGTTYVRDNSTVALDVDDDGALERLGANSRLSFETETVVALAVPPSGRGVGDVDGNADERSPGWSQGGESTRSDPC